MTELEDILNSLGYEPFKRSKISRDEIPILALAVSATKYREKCAWLIEEYRKRIETGCTRDEIDEWLKEVVENNEYPMFTKLYHDINFDIRHSWDGWLTERKFGFGAVQSIGERGVEMLEVAQPHKEEKKKHFWQRGEK